jgi:hypothetical protein
MTGLVPVIHAVQPPRRTEVRIDDSAARFNAIPRQGVFLDYGVDDRDKPGHDDAEVLLGAADYLLRSSYRSRQSGLASMINWAFQARE